MPKTLSTALFSLRFSPSGQLEALKHALQEARTLRALVDGRRAVEACLPTGVELRAKIDLPSVYRNHALIRSAHEPLGLESLVACPELFPLASYYRRAWRFDFDLDEDWVACGVDALAADHPVFRLSFPLRQLPKDAADRQERCVLQAQERRRSRQQGFRLVATATATLRACRGAVSPQWLVAYASTPKPPERRTERLLEPFGRPSSIAFGWLGPGDGVSPTGPHALISFRSEAD